MTRTKRKPTSRARPQTAADDLLGRLTVKGKRALTQEQAKALVGMFAYKRDEAALDVLKLAPPGSFPRRMMRQFR